MFETSDNPTRPAGPSIGERVADARRRLRSAAEVATSPREADLLLAHVLGWTESQVRARDDRLLSAEVAARFEALLRRRLEGEPVAYLIGVREFYGRDFEVDDRVLIPRPETEHLIEVVTGLGLEAGRVLDVGTGSGCIAVTLACEMPGVRLTATDLSVGALQVARRNAERHGVGDRVEPLRGHLTTAVDLSAFQVVVSNPPYVAPEAAVDMSPDVLRYEPHLALFAEDHGRALIVELLDAAEALRSGASLWLELGYDQGDWILAAIAARPYLRDGRCLRDYAGHPRVAGCVRV